MMANFDLFLLHLDLLDSLTQTSQQLMALKFGMYFYNDEHNFWR